MPCRVLQLNVADEASIAHVFSRIQQEFPDVSAGSYPGDPGALGPQLSISLECKDVALLEQAQARLCELLDESSDAALHTSTSLLRVDCDVSKLSPRRKEAPASTP